MRLPARMRHIRAIRFTALVTALALLTGSAHGIEVLLLWDNSTAISTGFPPERPPLVTSLKPGTQALIAAMEAAGFTVKLSNDSQSGYDGDTPEPDGFDAVVHLNGNSKADEFDEFLGPTASAAIEQYVRNGGAYIGSENNDSQIIGLFPAPTWLTNLTPIKVGAGAGPSYGTQTVIPTGSGVGHPLFDGLTDPIEFVGEVINSELRTYGTFPAETLAVDGSGNVTVAIRALDEGRVVGFYHRGNYRGPDVDSDTLSDATAQQLYINAIRWADQRPPFVESIEIDGAPASNGASVAFLVNFSESVTGVDLADFSFDAPTLGVGAYTVTPVTAKQYRIETLGVTGSGLLRLDLIDDASIKDESVGENLLSGGNFTLGDTLVVDAVAPGIEAISTIPFAAGSGDTPTLVIEFTEPMKSTIAPVVTLDTLGNGAIALTGGVWFSSDEYRMTLSRALVNADAGLATVTVATAQDLLGNLMPPYNDTPLNFGSTGLTATLSESGIVYGELNGDITFTVSLQGAVGTPQYEWKREVEDKAIISVGTNSPVLTLTDLTFDDSGTYFCVISDDADVTQTPFIFLSVVASLPVSSSCTAALMALVIALLYGRMARRVVQ